MGNKNNIIHNFADPVEERQIRHFACKEMGRQIHRYIKGMCGSKEQMLRFEKSLEDLSLEEREKAIALYTAAAEYALTKGIIICDTKFEFGLDENGTLTLMDEVLTPDSSRFWSVDTYKEGTNPPSFDKQFVRDWLEQSGWNKQPPAPEVPKEVIEKTVAKYQEALDLLTK